MWAQDKSPAEISKVLYGRTAGAVACRASNMNMKRSPNRQEQADKQKWTSAEIKLLQDLWSSTSVDEIAKIIGRTILSVNMKAYHLWEADVKTGVKNKFWQEPD